MTQASSSGYAAIFPRPNGEGDDAVASSRYTAQSDSFFEEEDYRNQYDQWSNSKLAAGKAISILQKMDAVGHIKMERESAYGIAIALPQIARSCGWPTSLLALAVRSYMFLLLNVCLQGFLISLIGQEAAVMNPFAGQMHLCDYGADLSTCPASEHCRGPGGTMITPPRLYSFDIWATRNFARDSIKALFPKKVAEINSNIDPGEYGVESYFLRLVCVFMFMVAVLDDLRSTIGLLELLRSLPSENGYWIYYDEHMHEPVAAAVADEIGDNPVQPKEIAKVIKDWTEMDFIKFRVAGMPFPWKVVNVFFVVLPKSFLWYCLTRSGVRFLFETASMIDMICNTMALSFILSIDEMVATNLTTVTTRHMMEKLEDAVFWDEAADDELRDEDAIAQFERDELIGLRKLIDPRFFSLLVPRRLVWVLLLMALFVFEYYWRNCDSENGAFVAKDLYLPKSVEYNPVNFLLGVEGETYEDPVWTRTSL